MTTERWHLITGEYPPDAGGVADYTALLAGELARNGEEVHVWTSAGPEATVLRGVTAHRAAGRWSRADLKRLDVELDAFPLPRRLLVQYAPNAWGYKGMNLGFCRWLDHRRRRGDEVRVMFHEVWYQLERRDKPIRWFLVFVQRLMARALMSASKIAYISIPSWESLLRRSEPRGRRPVVWLPVPSNVPVVSDPDSVADLRRQITPKGETLLASFGTFGETIGAMMTRIIPRLLQGDSRRIFLLMGRGSDRFASELIARHPELAGRLLASGGLAPAALSAHLQACDLFVQPYPDGVSSRRGSLMAVLAHGGAVVTNLGPRSEAIWEQGGGVALAADPDPEAIVTKVDEILASPDVRARLANSSARFYEQYFAIARTVDVITGAPVGHSV